MRIIILASSFLLFTLTSCFDDTEKLLEKCADSRYKSENIYTSFNFSLKLKEKMRNSDYYARAYKYCEEERKKTPSAFKLKYGK
jgi:hypothetical protein